MLHLFVVTTLFIVGIFRLSKSNSANAGKLRLKCYGLSKLSAPLWQRQIIRLGAAISFARGDRLSPAIVLFRRFKHGDQ